MGGGKQQNGREFWVGGRGSLWSPESGCLAGGACWQLGSFSRGCLGPVGGCLGGGGEGHECEMALGGVGGAEKAGKGTSEGQAVQEF